MREFEVEIDGAVFKVKQVEPQEDTDYGEEEAELVARACLLYEDEAEKKAYTENTPLKHQNTAEKAAETVKEIYKEKITEKYVAQQLENVQSVPVKQETQLSVNYRRQIEALSRYLNRDSRRYDGYFEMY